MSPPHRKKMRAKYTIKVPVEKISPLSFDSKGNIYFTTTDTFYRVSGRQVEQISAGNPFRQVTSESLQMGPQLANWPPLALSERNMFLPGPKLNAFSGGPRKGSAVGVLLFGPWRRHSSL